MILNMVGGGGGSSTKSTIIVSIDTGSTVGIYDSTYTTLIKSASEKSTGEYWLTGLNNGTYYIKATKDSDTATSAYTISEYGVYRISLAYRTVPEFTYTGTYELVDDNDQDISGALNTANWKIRFLTGGTLSFSNLYGAADGIDIFLVGGGGGGGTGNGGGGGGGYTATVPNQAVSINTNYTVTIGAGGASGGQNLAGGSSAFGGLGTANGGNGGAGAGAASAYHGGNGGSGGGAHYSSSDAANGGSDGSNGYGNASYIGTGQGTTTREFAEAGATLYAGGGAGAYGTGGAGGGGDGGNNSHTAGYDGTANTGGGGGGGKDGSQYAGGAGGSGIVIIRNARS